MALKGTRLGDKRPKKKVGEGLLYREVKDRLEKYLEFPILRGRILVVPLAVGRERSQSDDEGSVLGSVGPLGGALQLMPGWTAGKIWLHAAARTLNV